MIEVLKGFPENVAAYVCHGHVSKADYDTVLMPDVSDRLSRNEKLRLYYEVDPDFAGIDPGAIWEDTKVGLSHFLRWERFAVVTDVEWMRHSVKLFGFLMPGELRVFPLADAAQAREWITEE